MLKEDWDAYARRFGYKNEWDMFYDLYIVQKISVISLGERFGRNRGTIARRLDILGITKRSRGGANNQFSQQFRLWRFDQRILHLFGREIADVLEVSSATLKNYLESLRRVA